MKKYLTRLAAALLALVLLIAPASALSVDEALELLEAYYYYGVPEEAYEAESVEDLIRTLGDPYTQYMSREQYLSFLGQLEGEAGMAGIGAAIQYTQEGILITQALSGGSAQAAGIQAGDVIVEIDGASCVPANESHQQLLVGREGTQVTISVLRDGTVTQYTLTRRAVVVPNLDYQLLEGGVGWLDCNSFGADTGSQLAQIVKAHDGEVELWVLDLRGNGGGYVAAAIDMLTALDGPGYYLYYESAQGSVEPVSGRARLVTIKPVVVLLDGGSASASEVVSANLRDIGRAVTIGSRTFGKGIAQGVFDENQYPELFDGDCIKITFARFYTNSFNTTDRIGVIPTLLVDNADAEAVALALTGREGESRVGLVLGGCLYYVDMETEEEALAALFAALPPQAQVFYDGDGVFRQYSVPEVAQRIGLDYDSRWFDDAADSPYASQINAMGTYQLLQGVEDGRFDPEGQLTRAQLCVMLARLLNVGYQGGSQFSDVPMDSWYGEAVNAMAAAGLVNGLGDGRFDPDGTLTQEQFLTIMGRVARFINIGLSAYGAWLESSTAQLAASQEIALAPFSDWARSNTAVLAWGLVDALGDSGDLLYAPLSQIAPEAPVLREEAAAGMYAVLSGLGILL